ncbi:hypothetical protein BJ912DRAFT_1066694 [Pholiota molesta]|nr:hypothetical protein BJ912DRAFT_1066694 [Pholiota molesta]
MDPSTAQADLINLQKIRNEAFQALEKVKHLRNNNLKKKQAKEALKQAEENLTQVKTKATSSELAPRSSASSILTPCSSEADFPASEDPAPAAGHELPMPEHAPTAPLADNIPTPGAHVPVATQIPDISANFPAPGAHVPLADPFPIDPTLIEAPGANVPVAAQITDVSAANVLVAGPLQAKRKLPEDIYTIEDVPEDEIEPEEVLTSKKIKLTKQKEEDIGDFSNFTLAEKRKWIIAGRQAIKACADSLTSTTKKKIPIPGNIKAMVRKCQMYLPEAATHSAEVAKEFLATSPTGGKCLYHYTNRHASSKEPDTPEYLNGIPGEAKDSVGPVFGCGCPEEDVLFAFYLWKTCVATSTKRSCLNVIYRLGTTGQTNIPETPTPRMRSFWHQYIRDVTGISNLYAFYSFHLNLNEKKWTGEPWGSPEYERRICFLIIGAQQHRLKVKHNIHLEINEVPPPPPPHPLPAIQ